MPLERFLHPTIVNFTIALFLVSIIFDFWGVFRNKPSFHHAAWLNLIFSAISAVLSVATGLITKSRIEFGELSKQAIELHENFAFLISACILGLFFWRLGRKGRFPEQNIIVYFLLALFGALALLIGGYFGGELVYKYGVEFKALNY